MPFKSSPSLLLAGSLLGACASPDDMDFTYSDSGSKDSGTATVSVLDCDALEMDLSVGSADNGEELLEWSVSTDAPVDGIEVLIGVMSDQYQFALQQDAGASTGVEPRIPYDMTDAVGKPPVTMTVDGEAFEGDLSLALRVTSGDVVCEEDFGMTTRRPSPLGEYDDLFTSINTPSTDDSACDTMAVEVWRAATNGASNSSEGENAPQVRVTHPCSGTTFMVATFDSDTLSSVGIDPQADIADASVNPETGNIFITPEAASGVQEGVLVELDGRTGEVLFSQDTWSLDPGTDLNGKDLHHGLHIIDEAMAISAGWVHEDICGRNNLLSSSIAEVDLVTGEVMDISADLLNREETDCDTLGNGSSYHFYANSVNRVTMPDGDGGQQDGACLTVNDSGTKGALGSDGLLVCVGENGDRLAVTQEDLNFDPISNDFSGERATMDPINPFQHSVSMRVDDDEQGVTLAILSLGDPAKSFEGQGDNEDDWYEDPRVQVMWSELDANPLHFSVVCTYDLPNTGLKARHHSGVTFVNEGTLLVHYSRGDAPQAQVYLNLGAEGDTCPVVGGMQTELGQDSHSEEYRHLKWRDLQDVETAESTLGIRLENSWE